MLKGAIKLSWHPPFSKPISPPEVRSVGKKLKKPNRGPMKKLETSAGLTSAMWRIPAGVNIEL